MSFAVEFDSMVTFCRVRMCFGWPCGKGQSHSGRRRSGPRCPKVLTFASLAPIESLIYVLPEMISYSAPLAGRFSVDAHTICFTSYTAMLRRRHRAAKPWTSRIASSMNGITIKYDRVDITSTPGALVWHACCACSSLCVHYLLSNFE
jgi:hypothetical protein